jgi:hypothetical protein
MLLLAMPAATALSELQHARTVRADMAAWADAPGRARAPLVPAGLAMPAEGAGPAAVALARRLREQARAGGVLIEDVAAQPAPGGGLAAVRFSASGSEKGVLALADAIERQPPVVRLARWKLSALPGGQLRLEAEAVGAWR